MRCVSCLSVSGEMKTGNVVTAIVLIVVMGTAAYQWKTMVQAEMHVAQRNR